MKKEHQLEIANWKEENKILKMNLNRAQEDLRQYEKNNSKEEQKFKDQLTFEF